MEETSEVSEDAARSREVESAAWPALCRLAASDVENMKKGEVSRNPFTAPMVSAKAPAEKRRMVRVLGSMSSSDLLSR